MQLKLRQLRRLKSCERFALKSGHCYATVCLHLGASLLARLLLPIEVVETGLLWVALWLATPLWVVESPALWLYPLWLEHVARDCFAVVVAAARPAQSRRRAQLVNMLLPLESWVRLFGDCLL